MRNRQAVTAVTPCRAASRAAPSFATGCGAARGLLKPSSAAAAAAVAAGGGVAPRRGQNFGRQATAGRDKSTEQGVWSRRNCRGGRTVIIVVHPETLHTFSPTSQYRYFPRRSTTHRAVDAREDSPLVVPTDVCTTRESRLVKVTFKK